jgi:hypothetical protein
VPSPARARQTTRFRAQKSRLVSRLSAAAALGRLYFFSPGVGSADLVGSAGVIGLVLPGASGADPVAPVDGAPASAFGASAGAGLGVAGAEVLGAGAGGGGVTVVSSFLLQAVRPIAKQAIRRSERFMVFPLWDIIER